MIETLVHFLQENVLPLGATGVFLASVIEEVVAPIPSALIMTMSGFILVSGPVSLSSISALIFKVAIPAALGVTIGSYGVYFVARFGGRAIIERWGKYLGLYWKDVEKLKAKMSGTQRDEWIIGTTRVLPFFPSVVVSAFCGILEMNVVRYFIISFIGIFFRGIILGTVGWQVGNLYEKYAKTISSIEDVVLKTIVVLAAIFIIFKIIQNRKPRNQTN